MLSSGARRWLSRATGEAQLTLYSYRICPFCCKVKAAARWKQAAIANVEVNPLTKSQIAFSRDHRKVPIAVTREGRVVVESDRIIEELVPEKPTDEELRWTRWASEELAVVMYPNITRTFAECRQTLAYASEAFGPLEAWAVTWVGALGMSLAHSKVKKKYGIVDERQALGDRLVVWEAALQGGPFRGGRQEPDLSDVAVFGVLGAVAGTSAHDDIMSNHAQLAAWARAVDATLPPLRLVT